jgi:NAD(P)-dependent dehydrogenase (short-subunit alcohol dehydrogenase family)
MLDSAQTLDGNVFGHLRVVRAVLPYMREKRSGVIAFIGSAIGYFPVAMNGVYGASKFALAGISQSLTQEVAHLGIEVTIIEPGVFRTEGLANLTTLPTSIADYDPTKKAFQELLEAGFAIPPSDPVKGAQGIVEVLTKTGRCVGRALPRRLLLGGDVLPAIEAELALREKEKNDWSDFSQPNAFAFDP